MQSFLIKQTKGNISRARKKKFKKEGKRKKKKRQRKGENKHALLITWKLKAVQQESADNEIQSRATERFLASFEALVRLILGHFKAN